MRGLALLSRLSGARSASSLQSNKHWSTVKFEPLRILFCGSDNFSVAALEALHREFEHDPNFINSIDVVTRTGKWTGPNRKIFTEGMSYALADTKLTAPSPHSCQSETIEAPITSN
jgi:methionyl-tRNA formyltransferase